MVSHFFLCISLIFHTQLALQSDESKKQTPDESNKTAEVTDESKQKSEYDFVRIHDNDEIPRDVFLFLEEKTGKTDKLKCFLFVPPGSPGVVLPSMKLTFDGEVIFDGKFNGFSNFSSTTIVELKLKKEINIPDIFINRYFDVIEFNATRKGGVPTSKGAEKRGHPSKQEKVPRTDLEE